jgi:hypothetical protein
LALCYQSENDSRILIYSQRKIQQKDIFRCSDFEFEDTICAVDAADIFSPEYNSNIDRVKYLKSLLYRMSKKPSTAVNISPGYRKHVIDKEYDLFYAHCIFTRDLFALKSLEGWRKKCKTAVCYIAELWTNELDKLKEPIRLLLKQFDYILLSCSSSVDAVKDIVQRPCYYFPPGVDAIKFCPFPVKPHRCIDVFSMGRRSPVTHKALMDLAEKGKIFYVYDTTTFSKVSNTTEHRIMLANLIKRSRFFLAYPAKVDSFDERGGQEVLGYRYFEGAAGGAVLMGDVPQCEEADNCFDWPNTLTSLPYGADNIAEIIAELDTQPDRMSSIRRNNVVTSLLQHDWAYRWREILDIVGMKPSPALIAREKRLKEIAEAVRSRSNDII